MVCLQLCLAEIRISEGNVVSPKELDVRSLRSFEDTWSELEFISIDLLTIRYYDNYYSCM